MISRRTAAILLGSASLGLVAAATGPATAHPGKSANASNGKAQKAPAHARANHRHRGRRAVRGVRRCNIAPAQLLTTENNERLKKVDARLDAKVAAGNLTQERADKRFARTQKKVTVKVTMRTAKQAPVLALFNVADAAALRTAVKDAGGVRALIDATEGVGVAEFRQARRDGRKAAREARSELCSSGSTTEEKPESTPSL